MCATCVLPVRGSVLPVRGSVLPVRGSVLPVRGSVLPVRGSVWLYFRSTLAGVQNMFMFSGTSLPLCTVWSSHVFCSRSWCVCSFGGCHHNEVVLIARKAVPKFGVLHIGCCFFPELLWMFSSLMCQVCHAGPCGECPRAGERSCPCGKSRKLIFLFISFYCGMPLLSSGSQKDLIALESKVARFLYCVHMAWEMKMKYHTRTTVPQMWVFFSSRNPAPDQGTIQESALFLQPSGLNGNDSRVYAVQAIEIVW